MPSTWDPLSLAPAQALQRLIAGNRRFLEQGAAIGRREFNADLAERAQRPFAIVLGCSDSRTPVEILFDEGFGDLFVVRIAGNVVAPSVVGSIEFAASQFGTRLVVVLGHTRCGAIAATVGAIQSGNGPESKNIRAITDRIAPHIESFVRSNGGIAPALRGGAMAESAPPDAGLVRESMRINVRASVDHLRHGSRLLEELVLAGRIAIIGAEYELETGRVHFLDALPPEPDGG